MKSSEMDYTVVGTIRDQESGAPLSGLRVRAFDKDFFRNQLLGSGPTDENGRYEIRFKREDFTGPLVRLERHPDIFLHVLDPEDKLIYSTAESVVVGAGRHTSIDANVRYSPGEGAREGTEISHLFGVAVNVAEVAKLSSKEVLAAYKLMRSPEMKIEGPLAERIKAAFPGIFRRKAGAPECGNGIHEVFTYLMKERNALADFDPDPDPYSGATVKQFFTANIVVKYTTDATLPGGGANPNMLPAGSAAVPTADLSYTMPSGAVIGVVRANLADLDTANTEVAPTYIQKVGLLAEYALSHYIQPPFSYLDPRGSLTRLEFRILGLPSGVAGYAVASDFHMELSTSNSDGQNLGTVPHELFHLVQYRYNATGGPSTGIRGSMLEGGARLLEESINETPNRYVESAADGDLSTAGVPRKGIFSFPGETLLDISGSSSLLRYAAGLLWKYIAEQHSTSTGAADEPAIGVDAYRKIIERMTTSGDDFTIAGVRNGRAQLPWYGSFDQFSYYDTAATELGSHETTWANFLLANYFHKLWSPTSPGFDRRFAYMEDNDAPGNVAKLNTFSPAIAAGDALTIAQGAAITKSVTGHKPYAAVYYELTPSATSFPRMLRVDFTAGGTMTDPVVQIVRIGAGNALVDIHRSDRTSYSKTINMAGLTKVLVIVGSKEHGGDFTLHFDEQASSSDVMVTRWNSRAGTEYEADPRGWSWTWISPDIMVDTNGDLLDDTSVFFGQNNKLKVRLRNRGNGDANDIVVRFWYQKATPYLSTAAWIPVQNLAAVTQMLTVPTLAAGAEQWFEVDWAPVDDGTHHPHWCVKVAVSCATDPNADNKIAFRNFANLVVGGPDTDFSALVRYARWTEEDALLIVPRHPEWSLKIRNAEELAASAAKAPGCGCAAGHRISLGAPLDMKFAKLGLVESKLKKWNGKTTALPQASDAYYPTDEKTLPPGIRSGDVLTLAHVSGGKVIGGISYRVSLRPAK